VLSDADVRYIRENFRTLEEACAGSGRRPEEVRALIEAGVLPRPTYVLDDGTEMVPADYFALADAAGGPERLRDWFAQAYVLAAELQGGLARDGEVEKEWEGYLSGAYGACLKRITPETIVRKDRLMAAIERLVGEPRPDEAWWRDLLRASVDELDALERDFAPYDRERWGPVSRDRLITAPRERYPAVFA
jgi:hypothetical protein